MTVPYFPCFVCFLSLFCDNQTSEEHTVFPRFFKNGLRLGRYVVARDPVGIIPLYNGARRYAQMVGLDFFEHHMNLSIS